MKDAVLLGIVFRKYHKVEKEMERLLNQKRKCKNTVYAEKEGWLNCLRYIGKVICKGR